MKLVVPGFAAACAVMLAAPHAAHADGADVAAGLLGGLAIGAIVGATVASPPPPPVYVAPAPVYVAPAPAPMYMAPTCYWTRGQPVWDGYRWVRSRIQVCD
jgi:hypothetical protein